MPPHEYDCDFGKSIKLQSEPNFSCIWWAGDHVKFTL